MKRTIAWFVNNGVAAPPITALMARPNLGPPPMRSSTSPSGVPMGTSPTPWRRVAPVTVQTSEPGDSPVPIDRNASCPSTMIKGTLASVSTLLTSAGDPTASPPGPANCTCAADEVDE